MPHRASDATGIDGAGNKGSEHARRDVIRMSFNASRLIEHPQRFPTKIQQFVGDDDARRERRGARTEPFTDRDVVIDFEFYRREGLAGVASDRQRGLKNQIVLAAGDAFGVAARYADRKADHCAGNGTRDTPQAPFQSRRNQARGSHSKPGRLDGQNTEWESPIQLNLPPVAAGFVDGDHQFERAVAVLARHGRFTSGADRISRSRGTAARTESAKSPSGRMRPRQPLWRWARVRRNRSRRPTSSACRPR